MRDFVSDYKKFMGIGVKAVEVKQEEKVVTIEDTIKELKGINSDIIKEKENNTQDEIIENFDVELDSDDVLDEEPIKPKKKRKSYKKKDNK